MNSFEIRKARDGLIEYINNIQLPMEVKRYIVNEVKEMVDATTNREIQMQKQKEVKSDEQSA